MNNTIIVKASNRSGQFIAEWVDSEVPQLETHIMIEDGDRYQIVGVERVLSVVNRTTYACSRVVNVTVVRVVGSKL